MSDRVCGRKKAGTSNFSHPSLVASNTPTLANPTRGFGLTTNNAPIQESTEKSINLEQPKSGEDSLEPEASKKPFFGHDISRIPLHRPQAKLAVGELGDNYGYKNVMSIATPSMQRQMTLEEQTQQVQTKPLAAVFPPFAQRQVMLQEEEEIQTQPLNVSIPRKILSEPEVLQTKPALQRITVAPPTPATYHNATDIYAMTLNQFDSYAREQADWATSPAPNDLSAADQRILRRILEFGRSEFILDGCGEMTVQALKDKGTAFTTLDKLRVYSRAVSRGADTIQLQQTSNVDEALNWGTALKQLERTPGGSVIKRIFNEKGYTPGQLQQLIDADGGVEAFIRYYQTCHPMLEADNGAEIESYLLLLGESVHPESFKGRVNGVRNFHRFEKPALEQLATNGADTSKTKPFSLILHSGLDHNGAFHRDPALTAAITDNHNLTLMIEGQSSLRGIQDQLAPLARRYGQHNRISQVMIAGHGNSKGMELAGSVGANGEIREDGLDVDNNAARTDAFFNELLRNMDSSADGRIVLNACLTAANEVGVPLDADPATAKQQINNAIATHPSLATRVRQLVSASSGGMQTTVVGASGSFSEGPSLIDPVTGRFDIIPTPGASGSAGDTHLTDSDKFNYVRHGKDPEGALRAVVECWATDEARTLQMVTERHTELAASTEWKDRLIHASYGIILANPRNANLMNQLARSIYTLDKLRFDSECTKTKPASVSELRRLHGTLTTHLHTIFGELATARGDTYSKLVMYQAWMLSDSTKRANFLTELSSVGNCQIAAEYIDIGVIGNTELGALLPPPSTAGSAPRGELMLALIGVVQGNNTPTDACHIYLRAVIGSGGRTFPSGLGVNGLLGGLSSETSILELIGLGSSASTSPSPGGAPLPAPNVDLDRDGVNDFYVEPMTRQGAITAHSLRVRQRPGTTEPILSALPENRQIFVIGQSGDWYAIEYNHGTAFVYKRWVRLQRVL
ncbi:MAG: SH3 domain-containing protein [Nostoc sp. CreGUA01]|nr:SH3 domain-containing protein [Nostoc sp. CreGUA01]